MPSMLSRLIVVLSLSSLVGCTSLQTLADRGTAPISASQLGTVVGANNKLTITRSDGSMMIMTVTAVHTDAIEGMMAGASQVTRLPLDQIKKIERREFDGARTVILVLSVVGGLILLIQAAGASAAANNIG